MSRDFIELYDDCGDIVEDCENYRVLGTWNYCPKCRAKVVG